MSDYIKREDAVKALADMLAFEAEMDYCDTFTSDDFIDDAKGYFQDVPSADVAPVVRCEECKHLVVLNARDLYAHCKRHDIRFEPFGYGTRTNYCSWAERKDDED